MNLLESLTTQLNNKDVLKQLGQTVNAKPGKVKKAANLSLPVLIEALNRNTNTKKGAEDLTKALEKHQDADISNISGFLKNVDKDDGAKIIQHVLGGNSKQVQKNLSKKTGLDLSQIGGLLVQFAPLILSFLGNKKKEKKLDSAGVSGLTSVIAGMFGQGKKGGLLGVASQLLDSDEGGNILSGIGSLFGIK